MIFAASVLIALAAVGINPAAGAPPPTGIMVSNPEPSHGLWQITVYGTAQDDSIDIGFEDGRYVISSPDGVDFYDSAVGCESESPSEVRCVLPFGRRVAAVLNLGDDDLDLRGSVRVKSYGGGGSDTIDGSAAHDLMIGQGGRDRLFGRGGDDKLIGTGTKRRTGEAGGTVRGGAGDTVEGNAGDDRLLAWDGARDHRIAGGPGYDTAVADRRADPAPVGCEHVILRPF